MSPSPTHIDAQLTSAFTGLCEALNCEDWRGAAYRCDPASLTSFKRNLVARLASRREPAISAETLLQASPDMPRTVAEYQARQYQKYSNPDVLVAEEFAGKLSYAALAALEPRDLFTIWLEARSPRSRVTQAIESGTIPRDASDEVLAPDALAMWDYRLVGTVRDGDTIGHALYGSHVSEEASRRVWCNDSMSPDELELAIELYNRSAPSVLTFRLMSGTWRALAGYNFFFDANLNIIGYRPKDAV